MVQLHQVKEFLDEFLEINKAPASESNGMQISGKEDVRKIALAVDPAISILEQAVAWGADLLIVHHPLIHEPVGKISSQLKNRLKIIIPSNLSIYACHNPLDSHMKVGNAVSLAKLLGVEVKGPFSFDKGVYWGCWGTLSPISVSEFAARVNEKLGQSRVIRSGPSTIKKVAVATGSVGPAIKDAAEKGIDTVVTGELTHHASLESSELHVNVIFSDHYLSEQFGIQELGKVIVNKFPDTETKFFPTQYEI